MTMCRSVHWRMPFLFAVLMLSACANTPKLAMDLPIPPEKLAEFNECLVPAELKAEASSETEYSLEHLANASGGATTGSLGMLTPLAISVLGILRDHYANLADPEMVQGRLRVIPFDVGDVKQRAEGLWEALEDALWLKPKGVLRGAEAQGQAQSRKTLSFIREYLRAYFGSGELAMLELDAKHPERWAETIIGQLQPKVPPEARLPLDNEYVRQLRDGLLVRFQGVTGDIFHVPVQKAEPGFVSRSGSRYRFPGLSGGAAGVVDYSQIGADLIRVVLEAVRDSTVPLPAVSDATGVKLGVPVFNPQDPKWHATPQSFLEIETRASQAEATVAAAVGQAGRGASWGALNNEAVAKLVETAAGVIARHSAERTGWCAHKVCGLQVLAEESDSLR